MNSTRNTVGVKKKKKKFDLVASFFVIIERKQTGGWYLDRVDTVWRRKTPSPCITATASDFSHMCLSFPDEPHVQTGQIGAITGSDGRGMKALGEGGLGRDHSAFCVLLWLQSQLRFKMSSENRNFTRKTTENMDGVGGVHSAAFVASPPKTNQPASEDQKPPLI